jgi:NAD(P)-dependent dehydrogenase (short-subunit alcohol dehydrogenase family)
MSAEQHGRAPGRGRLTGRKILIVGGGQDERGQIDPPVGNGRAMSILFAREGAHVAIADRSLDAARKTAALIESENGRAAALAADVADPEQVQAMIAGAVSAMGGLDGFVFNVGVAIGGQWLAGTAIEDWRKTVAVNLDAAFFVAQAALPALSDGGSCVFISSVAGKKPGSRFPVYDATKAGLEGLMRHVALEGARRNIRANIVMPGLIDTSIGRAATEGRPSRAATPVPLGRQGTGWEVAYAALFLISGESSYVTGQVLPVDGGLTSLR